MSDGVGERPGEVTAAGWFAGACGLLMLISTLDLAPSLRTIEMHDWVSGLDIWGTLGIPERQAVPVLTGLLLVTAVAGAAVCVLSRYVLRRDKGARIALTLLTLPMVLGGFFVGQMLAAFALVAVVLLWSPGARDWYNQRTRRPAPWLVEERQLIHPSTRPGTPESFRTPSRPASKARAAALAEAERPLAVRVVCALTWLSCLVVGVGLVVALVMLESADAGAVRRALLEAGPSARAIGAGTVVATSEAVCVAGIAWCLVASWFAARLWSGRPGARIPLAVSTGWCAVLTFSTGFAAWPLWLVSALSLAVLAVLLSPGLRGWAPLSKR